MHSICEAVYVDAILFFQASLLSRIAKTLMFTAFVLTCSAGPSSRPKKESGCTSLKGFGIPAATKHCYLVSKDEVSTAFPVNDVWQHMSI